MITDPSKNSYLDTINKNFEAYSFLTWSAYFNPVGKKPM